MLLLLLSTVVVSLAHPGTDSNGLKPSTVPTSIPSTLTTKQDITTDVTETIIHDVGNEKCECVRYDLCDEVLFMNEFYIPTDSVCDNYLDVCCKIGKSKLPTTIKTKVIRGCGYRNPQEAGNLPSTGSKNSGETPWVVALMVGNTTVGAGALVHPQVVLTAAHVLDKYPNKTFIIRAGEWHTQTDKQPLEPQERTVDKIKIHKDFVKGVLKNDIALLYLHAPMKLADNVNVICLPDQDEDFDQSQGCIANGWAKDSSGTLTLKKVEADILSSESCAAKLRLTRLGKWFQLHKSFICAEEKKDYTCTGDGGAPLVCPGPESYKVSGLVAWGIGCGDNIPAVYAKVSMFREWIDDSMREWGFTAEEWV